MGNQGLPISLQGEITVGQRVIRRNISLMPEDVDLLREIARRYGLSFSGAIRFVVRDLRRMQEATDGGTSRDEAKGQRKGRVARKAE